MGLCVCACRVLYEPWVRLSCVHTSYVCVILKYV